MAPTASTLTHSRHHEVLAKRASKGDGPDRAASFEGRSHPEPSPPSFETPASRAPQDEGDGRRTRPPQDDGQRQGPHFRSSLVKQPTLRRPGWSLSRPKRAGCASFFVPSAKRG